MVAPEKAQEKEEKQNVRPADSGPIRANLQRNAEKSNIAAIFVGLFMSNSVEHALFVNSCPNSGRLESIRRDHYYKAFAVATPHSYSNSSFKPICGLPYLFSSRFEKLATETSIYLISCDFDDITVLDPRNSLRNPSSPIIRGTFHEIKGRFCGLRISEYPPVKLFSPPMIQVFYDQVSGRPGFALGNDVLLETRTGFSVNTGTPFVCVANFSCTIHRGDFSHNAI